VEGRGRWSSALAARRRAGTQRPSPRSQSLRRLARKRDRSILRRLRCWVRANAAKTRRLECGRFAVERAARRGCKPETVDFLGFTHLGSRTRRGRFQGRRKTSRKRLRRVLTATGRWCTQNRQVPAREQGAILWGKFRGHSQDYGVAGHRTALPVVSERVVRAWRQWLNRRRQRARMTWRKFTALLRRSPLLWPVLYAVPSPVLQGVLV